VLSCCGRAPASLVGMDDQLRGELAALCDEDGVLIEGAQEKCRLILVRNCNRRARELQTNEPPVTEG
jgi:hypothetical protein